LIITQIYSFANCKREDFEMSKADERIVELLKSLTCYSVKELGIMREMYLKDIERVADNGMFEKLKYSGGKCFDFAIRIKMEESGEEYAENDSCTG
jgi:hypothetical protein